MFITPLPRSPSPSLHPFPLPSLPLSSCSHYLQELMAFLGLCTLEMPLLQQNLWNLLNETSLGHHSHPAGPLLPPAPGGDLLPHRLGAALYLCSPAAPHFCLLCTPWIPALGLSEAKVWDTCRDPLSTLPGIPGSSARGVNILDWLGWESKASPFCHPLYRSEAPCMRPLGGGTTAQP